MFIDDKILMAALPALAGFLKWVSDYSKEVRWPRAKFLDEKMSSFLSDPDTKAVLIILDWNASGIEIPGDSGREKINFTDQTIIQALATNDERTDFTRQEFHIRALFDKFFDNLSQFNIWAETGLIDKGDAKKYIKYYLDILSGVRDNKPRQFTDAIKKYIKYYDFSNAHKLIYSRFW